MEDATLCGRCGKKPIYHKGLGLCRKCRREHMLENMTPEELAAHRRANADRAMLRYYQDPRVPDEMVAYNRAWRAENREKANAYSRKWTQNNPRLRRRAILRCKYGLSEEQLDWIEAHDGVCDSCREAPAAHTDHDHRTKEFRGLLCAGCNPAAGHLVDSPERARRLARYLEGSRLPGVSKPPPRPEVEVEVDFLVSPS